MRAKIKLQVMPNGETKVVTIQNVGTSCRAIADQLAEVLGEADESSRSETEDINVTGESDLTVSS